jgi:hypothetical protein
MEQMQNTEIVIRETYINKCYRTKQAESIN